MFGHPDFPDHALLDSGDGEKLERFGEVVLRRPDPQAIWRPRRGPDEWGKADLRFERDESSGGRSGRWIAREGTHAAARGETPEWTVRFGGGTFVIRPTPFKHVGMFPEQAGNWLWVRGLLRQLADRPRVLNLFGYTGVASVLAVRAGASVTHVDASRTAIAWARENATASQLPPECMRVILDDALTFASREVRRGSTYEGILLDPPHHGRGPKGETWSFEDDVAPLIEACSKLLAERSFLLLSSYAIGTSPLAFKNLLVDLLDGEVESDELALPEKSRAGEHARHLPAGFCARWRRGLGRPG